MVDPPASKQPIAKRSTGQNNGANACRLRRVMLGVGANRASQARSVSAVQRPAKSVWRLDVAVRARALRSLDGGLPCVDPPGANYRDQRFGIVVAKTTIPSRGAIDSNSE